MDDLNWFKSSKSGEAHCVEVANLPDAVLCRDAKDKDGPRLRFSHTAWRGFVTGIKGGDLR